MLNLLYRLSLATRLDQQYTDYSVYIVQQSYGKYQEETQGPVAYQQQDNTKASY
jgi:hypothetical protein